MFEKFAKLSDKVFRQGLGVERSTFDLFLKFLQEAQNIGKPLNYNKKLISLENQLIIWFRHMVDNTSFLRLSIEYQIPEKSVLSVIKWVEKVLSRRDELKLPGKEAIPENEGFMVVDLDDEKSPMKSVSGYLNKFRGVSEYEGSKDKSEFELKLRLIAGIYNLEKREK